MWTADDVGQSLVLLALVFLGAGLIRKWSRHLRALFVPTAVIGGFLALALGPEGVGRVTHSNGIFPSQTFALWTGREFFRRLFELFGSDFFEKFPLFPFTIIGGVLVQLVAIRSGFGWAVNRRAVEGLGGLAIDGIVICAIGTLSLGALGANVGPLVILAVASVAWSIVLVLVIGRRVFEQNWFEHSIAEFGEGQGNVATGFMMVDMIDPAR
jgi:Na+/glutamate symporter